MSANLQELSDRLSRHISKLSHMIDYGAKDRKPLEEMLCGFRTVEADLKKAAQPVLQKESWEDVTMITAYCWRSGRIEFGQDVPEGALPLITGEENHIRKLVDVRARHAYEQGVLLVPGIPEAANDEEAYKALSRFKAWLQPKTQRE